MVLKLIAQAMEFAKQGKADHGTQLLLEALTDVTEDSEKFQLYYHLGFIYRSSNNYKKAEDCYIHALRLAPENADVMCALGIVYQQKEDFEKAVALFDKALKKDRALITAYNSLGYTYHLMGEYETASQTYQKGIDELRGESTKDNDALKKTIDYAVLCNNMATALIELGDTDRAEELFDEAIAFTPKGMDYQAPAEGLKRLRDV